MLEEVLVIQLSAAAADKIFMFMPTTILAEFTLRMVVLPGTPTMDMVVHHLQQVGMGCGPHQTISLLETRGIGLQMGGGVITATGVEGQG